MKAYKQIPRWWYVAVLVGAYAIAQASEYWKQTAVLYLRMYLQPTTLEALASHGGP